MNTVRDRAAPVDKPAANAHTHPDVADFPRRRRTLPPLLADRLETMAFRTAYDMYAKAGYQGEISADWLAVRLNGYARTHFGSETPDYAYILQLCTHVAHETVYGRNVTPERRIQSRQRWGRANCHEAARARWEPTADARAERNEGIITARAGGQTVKATAIAFGISERTVKAVATPSAVAAWQEGQMPISPPLPDDSQVNSEDIESSPVDAGERHLPPHWVLNKWRIATGESATNAQAVRLVSWAEDPDVDAWRLAYVLEGYTHQARDPLAYLAKSLANGPEYLPDLKRLATPRALAYAETADNPRAFLAACIRNGRPPPPPSRTGYIDDVRRMYGGTLPWEATDAGI